MSASPLPRQETVHKVPLPEHFYSLLQAKDGTFLHVREDGLLRLTMHTGDAAIWDQIEQETFENLATGLTLTVQTQADNKIHLQSDSTDSETLSSQSFTVVHGPEKLPSTYLTELRQNGWTCLTQILDDETLKGLEKVACTDRYEGNTPDRSQLALCQHRAVARTVAEPVSLWVIRQYLQTDIVRLSHTPGFAVLRQDDGKRNVQGWHSDFPYHWGVPAKGVVPTATGETSLGVQRNVCVSPFTREGGGTIFKLGSHALDKPPPEEWGNATTHSKPGYREANGLPYGGPEADVVDAPGGSIILYDSRTWHRAGVNNTTKKRAALLQAMTPMFIFPKNDTSRSYKQFIESEPFNQITAREQDEVRNLMVHQFIGPGGEHPITVDSDPPRTLEQAEGRGGY